MDRSIVFSQSQDRSYDHLWSWRLFDWARGQQMLDVLGQSGSVVTNLGASASTVPNMNVAIAAGDIYSLSAIDATAYGSLPADTNQTLMQGFALAQSVLLTTSGLTSGQSRWALIWAQFSQTDEIPGDDPTGGVLNYVNTADPGGAPYIGPDDDNTAQNTRRLGVCTIGVTYGPVATTGSEAPPSPPGNAVPLYLVDIIFGQSQITNADILISGPSVGNNVPNDYPYMPVLAGLLNSHHGGTTGQAPQILNRELATISSDRAGSGISAQYVYAGNPNGHVAGTAGAVGISAADECLDTVHGIKYFCSVTGNAATAVWLPIGVSGAVVSFAGAAPSTGSANAQVVATLVPTGFSLTQGYSVTFVPGYGNTGATTLAAGGTAATAIQKNSGGSLVALTGAELVVNQPATVVYNGTAFVLQSGVLSQAAFQGLGTGLGSQGGNTAIILPVGQGQLQYSSATALLLAPVDGGYLWINGFLYPIPASLTVSNSGLSDSTLYYVYAWMNSGTMTLEAVTTGWTANANGIRQKTGDASRTLVGMAYVGSGGTFSQALVASRFYRRPINQLGNTSFTSTTSAGSLTDLGSGAHVTCLVWGDAGVQAALTSSASNFNGGDNGAINTAIGLDGSAVGATIWTGGAVNGGQLFVGAALEYAALPGALAEGLHTFSIFGATTGGAVTWDVAYLRVSTFG